jgi:ABC-type proline/glycine betaine transport system permease subunit
MEKSVAERQILRDAIRVGGVYRACATEVAAALGILGLGQVAIAGVVEQDFASASDLEPLGHGFFRFDAFGSSHKS